MLWIYKINIIIMFQGNFLEPKTEAFSWKMCGSKSDAIQIKTLSVAPDPIKLPGNITLAFSGSIISPEPITAPIEVRQHMSMKHKTDVFNSQYFCSKLSY